MRQIIQDIRDAANQSIENDMRLLKATRAAWESKVDAGRYVRVSIDPRKLLKLCEYVERLEGIGQDVPAWEELETLPE